LHVVDQLLFADQGGQGAAMAFEDADTLAYVLARAISRGFDQRKSLPQLFENWERHRFERIGKVMAFTTRGGAIRKSNLSTYEQIAKEWLLWLMFKWTGPEGGAKWMYTYSAESVLADIS
jgi:2-polyprenyl-6-methoxyphenol hydroxylase-like FAD-dependent oxidoreductase